MRAERRPPSNGRRARLKRLRCSTSRRSRRRPTRFRARSAAAELTVRPPRLPRAPLRRRSRARAQARARPRPRGRCRRSEPPRSGSRRSRRRAHRRPGAGRWSTGRSSAPRRWRRRPRGGPERASSVQPRDLDRVVAHAEHRLQEALVVQRQAAQRFFVCGHFSSRVRAASLGVRDRRPHFTPAARPRHHANCVKWRRAPACAQSSPSSRGAFDRAVARGDIELAVDGHRL